ncbi:MAG TPA: rod shape-determining protein [Candidatus Paceibacterota bacterium]
MFERLKEYLSLDIGVDLGTANTLVYVKGKGIVVNEPSVVAINQKTGQVVAVGKDANKMVGRTPGHVVAVRPLVDGVISNFEATEEMLAHFIRKALETVPKKLLGPRVVVGIPSGITNVEKRAVRDAARNAGAREVHLIEEPMAGAIGTRLPVNEPVGSMVIDIGGGTTDVAVISLGGIVSSKNLRIAGDKLNDDIVNYVRDEFKILIGEKTAENIKLTLGSAVELDDSLEMKVRGRDLVTGLPREITLTDTDIREAIAPSVHLIMDAVKEVLEVTPPEVMADVMNRGLVLLGGGALIQNLSDLLSEELKVPVYIAEDPLTCVVRGAGFVLEDLGKFRNVLIAGDDELPPSRR